MIAKLLIVTTIALCSIPTLFAADNNPSEITTVPEAVAWLEKTSTQMIRDSLRKMNDGTSAFPPQVGTWYEAFWLRDYAYMLEGNKNAFTDDELKAACRLFIRHMREDGAGVDCVKFDGTPVYKPGYDTMGDNPVADGSPFTVDVAWRTYQQTKDTALVKEIIDALVKTMNACPRHPESGLVWIDPTKEWDRCPYGFTDTVHKKGAELFSSLLYVQACRQLADLLPVTGQNSESAAWIKEAERVAQSIRQTFWDEVLGLFRAATIQCKEPDIWGSAFAVYLDVATLQQIQKIAAYFKTHYDEIVQVGQIRHIPGGMYWEVAADRDQYQNGAYWGTPAGWFAYALDFVDPTLADRTILDLVHDYQKRGVNEWVIGERTQLPGYNASASLPLAGIRKMLERRSTGK